MINKITGANKYCGPGALSAVLGIPTHETSRLIREACPEVKSVKGLTNGQLKRTLESLGIEYKFLAFSKNHRPTMNQHLQKLSEYNTPVIVNVYCHYIVVDKGQWTDNTVRKLHPLEEYPRKRQRIYTLFVITHIPEGAAPKREPKKKFEGNNTFEEIIQHYAPSLSELCLERVENMGYHTKEELRWAWDDCKDLYVSDTTEEREWRVANLQLNRRGVFV